MVEGRYRGRRAPYRFDSLIDEEVDVIADDEGFIRSTGDNPHERSLLEQNFCFSIGYQYTSHDRQKANHKAQIRNIQLGKGYGYTGHKHTWEHQAAAIAQGFTPGNGQDLDDEYP